MSSQNEFVEAQNRYTSWSNIYISPFPEHIGTTLVLVLPFTLHLQVITEEWNFLLLGKILAAGEVLRELARAELHGVRPGEVGAAGGQPLLVIQLLVCLALLQVIINDAGIGIGGDSGGEEGGAKAEEGSSSA